MVTQYNEDGKLAQKPMTDGQLTDYRQELLTRIIALEDSQLRIRAEFKQHAELMTNVQIDVQLMVGILTNARTAVKLFVLIGAALKWAGGIAVGGASLLILYNAFKNQK